MISFPSAVHGRPFCDDFHSGFAVHALRRGRSAFTFFCRGFGKVFVVFAAEDPDAISQPRDDCIVSRGESDPFCKQVRCPMLQSSISLPISLRRSLFQPTMCSAPLAPTLTVFRSSSTRTTRACVRKVSTFECKHLNMIPYILARGQLFSPASRNCCLHAACAARALRVQLCSCA